MYEIQRVPLCHRYLGFSLWSVNRHRLARESTANIWWKFCHVLGPELLNTFLFLLTPCHRWRWCHYPIFIVKETGTKSWLVQDHVADKEYKHLRFKALSKDCSLCEMWVAIQSSEVSCLVPEVTTFQVEEHIALLKAFHSIRTFLPILSLNQFPCNFHPGIGYASSFRSHREATQKPFHLRTLLIALVC